MVFFSEARVPPPSGASPHYSYKYSSGSKEDGVPPVFGTPGLETPVTAPGFGSDGSSGYGGTQQGTSRLVCTPVNCPTPSGICGVVYINLEAQTSSHGDQNKGHIAMAPSSY